MPLILSGDYYRVFFGPWYVTSDQQQINLAGYYCICDLLLIWQWWYYGKYYHDGVVIEQTAERDASTATEQTPLLNGTANFVQKRVEPAWVRARQAVTVFFDGFTPLQLAAFKYATTLSFVVITGIVAWFAADPQKIAVNLIRKPAGGDDELNLHWDGQALGWLSAVLYIASRIPQILKNRHTKCAGLSLALFIFAVGGNVTYVLVCLCLTTVHCI